MKESPEQRKSKDVQKPQDMKKSEDMKYQVLSKEAVFQNRFVTMERADLRIDTFRATPLDIERYGLLRPNVVGALVYVREQAEFLMVEQFRYSTTGTGSGWLKEVVAGVIEGDDDPEETAKREILEEVGYSVDQIRLIAKYYTSPGFSNQYTYFYYAETTAELKVQSAGGGLADEGEDICVHHIPVGKAYEMLQGGEFQDAMTIAGLQHFFLFIDPSWNNK